MRLRAGLERLDTCDKLASLMPTYVLKNNEQLGPFDDAMIFTCLADGRFLYEDLAWREGWANWRQLREVYPAPSRQGLDTAPGSQKADGVEENLWTGRPSYWHYWPAWVLAMVIAGAGIGMPYAGAKRWFANYLQWNDLQPWTPQIAAAAIGLGIVIILFIFIARLRWLFTVTNKRMMMRWGLLARSMEEIRIQDIRSINVSKKGLSGIFLNIGTVEFSSAATDMADVTFWQIRRPYKVRDLVHKLQT